jgi:ABC-type multidrug transport system fused ATPase/permease subunit
VLRNSISIIPQIPFLFTDTIRRNLDPLGLYSDEVIWQALQDTGLKEKVESFEQRLD